MTGPVLGRTAGTLLASAAGTPRYGRGMLLHVPGHAALGTAWQRSSAHVAHLAHVR